MSSSFNNVSEAIIPASYVQCALFEVIVSVFCVSITGFLGVIGNILTLTVLYNTKNQSVTVFLLNILAVSDLFCILLIGLLIVLPSCCRAMTQCPGTIGDLIVIIEIYGWSLASMAHTINIYITVLVTIHRYITVCKPPNITARFSTHKQARYQLGIICTCGVIYNIPRLFEYRYVKDDADLDDYHIQRQMTDIGNNIWYQVIYKNICYILLIFIIPFTILTLLSYRLGKVIKIHHKNRRNFTMAKRQSREDNTTKALIIIIVIFVFCQTPTLMQRLLYLLGRYNGDACGFIFFYISRITDFLVILNCSVNFIVYILFAKQFRNTFYFIICRSDCT